MIFDFSIHIPRRKKTFSCHDTRDHSKTIFWSGDFSVTPPLKRYREIKVFGGLIPINVMVVYHRCSLQQYKPDEDFITVR